MVPRKCLITTIQDDDFATSNVLHKTLIRLKQERDVSVTVL